MELKNKKIGVLGICKSGVYASLLLKSAGNTVYLSDISSKNVNEYSSMLDSAGMDYECGRHNEQKILDSDIIVVSPGIPESAEIMKKLRQNNKYVISEIEAAWRFVNKPVIGITGSNGKTTVTSLIGKIMNDAGYETPVCGNIGFPLSRVILEKQKYDCIALELSSFQLDTIDLFRPFVSVLTNITPNHLDRYSDFEEYKLSKKRIFKNQLETDYAVINGQDKNSLHLISDIKPPKKKFNAVNGDAGLFYQNGWIYQNHNGTTEKYIDVSKLKIFGKHNYENVMTAALAVSVFDIPAETVRKSVSEFSGVEHRIEFFYEINNVKYYNDSKATTVDALKKSLEAFECPVILIAGGRDKNADFTSLPALIKSKVKKLILTGESVDKMNHQINLPELTVIERDFDEAVLSAKKTAEAGDAVLLSPACTSYDRFNNFEERGRYFKELVRR